MFRGKPPQGRLFPLTEHYQKGLLAPKEMDVMLNSVKMSSTNNVNGHQPEDSDNGSGLPATAILTVQLETDTTGLSKKKCIDLYSSECSLQGDADSSDEFKIENPEGLVQFAVTHKNCPKLNLKLATKKSSKRSAISNWFGNGRRASIASSEKPIDLFALSKANSDETLVPHRLAVTSSKAQCQNYILTELKLNLSNERLGPAAESKFRIQPGAFYETIIPEDIEKLWGPIPLQKLPSGVSNKCRAVTHGYVVVVVVYAYSAC